MKKRVDGKSTYYDLKLPDSQSVCTLYDFELILAKKMDGQRDLAALVAEAGKLALPLDVKLMEKFIRGLECYHFLDQPEPVTELATPVLPEVPTLAVEEAPPSVGRDMDELLATIRSPEARAAMTGENAPVQPEEPASLVQLWDRTALLRLQLDLLCGRAGLVIAPLSRKLDPVAKALRRRVRLGIANTRLKYPRAFAWAQRHPLTVQVAPFCLLVLLLLGGSAALEWRSAVKPEEGRVISAEVSTAGLVDEVRVPRGARVVQGQVVAVIHNDEWKDAADVAPVARSLEQAEAELARLKADHEAELDRARRLVAYREGELTRREKTLLGLKPSRRLSARAKRAAEARVTDGLRQLSEAQEQLLHLQEQQEQALASAQVAVEERRQKLDEARAQYSAVEVRAPTSGVLITDVPSAGQRVQPGQLLFAIAAD